MSVVWQFGGAALAAGTVPRRGLRVPQGPDDQTLHHWLAVAGICLKATLAVTISATDAISTGHRPQPISAPIWVPKSPPSPER
jgi:hypothetical protein